MARTAGAAVALTVMAVATLFSGASAQYCVDDYNVTVPLLQGDGEPLDVRALWFTKLTNVQLVWTEGDKDEPIKLAAYSNEEVYDITKLIRTTMASDEENKGTLQIDAKEDMDMCLYVIIPTSSRLRRVTVEGMAEVNVGPMVYIPAFEFIVKNGYIRSSAEVFVDALGMLVEGNGAITFRPPASNVIDLTAVVEGTGNITFSGNVVSADVQVEGEGVIVVGTVLEEAKLDLQGRQANATIVTADSKVKVSGNAALNNRVTLVGGATCSKVKTKGKDICKTGSGKAKVQPSALVVTG